MSPRRNIIRKVISALTVWAFPALVYADTVVKESAAQAGETGVNGLWVISNIIYAGMRAQGNATPWRFLVMLLGFPGTVLTWFVV